MQDYIVVKVGSDKFQVAVLENTCQVYTYSTDIDQENEPATYQVALDKCLKLMLRLHVYFQSLGSKK